ncbi:MAG: PhzF family phenazine biosynthesis isomerase [Clostridiales bacterium]|nr:PhzF family phenazine biosynthesis isomerase [Clostridiales bacterium]
MTYIGGINKMKIYYVDAFTSTMFKGNPAAVCLVDENISKEMMQSIAMEINLSETAFVVKKGNVFLLRWFTPKTEVDLCGHATLATAHTLYENNIVESHQSIEFQTNSGLLRATKQKDMISLDFPTKTLTEIDKPNGLEKILGIDITSCHRTSTNELLVEVDSESALIDLEPNVNELKNRISEKAICVTSKSEKYDFVSRFFAPAIGIDEDPVTGSAHCVLVSYWSEKLNKTEFIAYQASKRGGIIHCKLNNDRVILSGSAITVMECNTRF